MRLARVRVPLGFLCAAIALGLARPSLRSWCAGILVAVFGEAVRLWSAGHIEKGREITRSGPYRYVRHPLYLGSTLLAAGFCVAAHSVIVASLAAAYLAVTLMAAIRTEESVLDARFAGEYSKYRDGLAPPSPRSFSWARAMANREYRAVIGLAAAFVFLAFRIH